METVTPESVGFSSERLARIRPMMQSIVAQGKLPGVVTMLARHGKVAHFDWVGNMDAEAGKPLQPDTIFRIYSMSKPVTAAAVMMLYEEGHFLLDDPIADFIPEFADTKVFVKQTEVGQIEKGVELADLERPITIRHLLTHKSGMTYPAHPDEPGTPVERMYFQEQIMRWDEPLAEKMARLARLPLRFQPGSAWNYGVSIDVLGRIVEVVSGLSFDAFLKQRMFDPLGMVDTSFNVPGDKLGRVATIYFSDEKGMLRNIDKDPGFDVSLPRAFFSGGGGLSSTASDYFRFAQMLLNKGELDGVRLLGRKTVELMTASQMTREQLPFAPESWSMHRGYGMALGVGTVVDVPWSGALGSVGNFRWGGLAGTEWWADPKEDVLGVIMIQVISETSRVAPRFQTLAYAALED